MSTIIIISKCLGTLKEDTNEKWYKFHFKGVCFGKKINGVYLKSSGGPSNVPIQGVEYIIYFKALNLNGKVLRGDILKIKPLDSCCDIS